MPHRAERLQSAIVALIVAILFSSAIPIESAPPPASRKRERAETNRTGPQTEKRFPPLQLPKGFQATLFACDPLVEYPSVIAIGPQPGTLFVAHDYVTGLGIEIVRRDEIRLLRDTDGDGYADKSILYAGGFNSIQGLAYHDGTVFVMHAPLLTALMDTNGDGVADRRRDIVNGLGLPPEKNPNRLHCANGVVAAHDGWLYLALGDRGCDVRRPEGDRLLFQQGGILRCRPDGRDLHVFAGGLRNIYDVVLDAELNVFVRDNENDGGDYMIRVCRSFFGADHGYPYLYGERPDEALRTLADLGRGSSAGGTSYLETAFPQEYRDSLFFCEWGRAVVRYRRQRKGSGFAAMKEIDFAAGATNDPYGFKPTDLVVDYDGSLLVSDWCDGQRPKRGRGRIYRIMAVGAKTNRAPRLAGGKTSLLTLLGDLDSPSGHVRVAAQREIERRGPSAATEIATALKSGRLKAFGKMHAVWILAHLRPQDAVSLFHIAENDADAGVRVQAVRALGDLTDPVLARHRLAAGCGDEKVAARLAALVTKRTDPRVVLEVLVALGRLRWSPAPEWLERNWTAIDADDSVAQAAMQLLRRADNWPAVLRLLDMAGETDRKRPGLRTLALRAIGDRAETSIVDGLIARLKSEPNAGRRRDYIDALARVHNKPPAWTYWGFRPAPRPANTVTWERTAAIASALGRALGDSDTAVRAFALQRMRRENTPVPLAALSDWLRTERKEAHVAAILAALAEFPPADARPLLVGVVRERSHSEPNRLLALTAFVRSLDDRSGKRLLETAAALEDGPVLAAALRALSRKKIVAASDLLLKKLDSRHAAVRAAAIDALAELRVPAAANRVVSLLADTDVTVRRAAAAAAGKLNVVSAAAPLRKLAADPDRELRRASLQSLLRLRDAGAVPQAVAALKFEETQLAALAYLEEFGSAKHAGHLTALAAVNRSNDVAVAIVRALVRWNGKEPPASKLRPQLERAVADVHRANEILIHWTVAPPSKPGESRSLIGNGADAVVRIQSPTAGKRRSPSTWLAVSHVSSDRPVNVEFLGSAEGSIRVRLNGKSVFQRKQPAAFRPDADRFDAQLTKGMNRLVVEIQNAKPASRFHLRFRLKSTKADHERLVRLALQGGGSALRGRGVFLNAEKSQCVKCHRLGDEGGRIGPDLTGVGSRFSTIHLVESLLEPSRTIAPSYATVVVALSSGRVLTGVKTAETATTLTLGDNQGKTHTIAKRDVETTRTQSTSTMPDGLEKRLTDQEFADLIAFLRSQKKPTTK